MVGRFGRPPSSLGRLFPWCQTKRGCSIFMDDITRMKLFKPHCRCKFGRFSFSALTLRAEGPDECYPRPRAVGALFDTNTIGRASGRRRLECWDSADRGCLCDGCCCDVHFHAEPQVSCKADQGCPEKASQKQVPQRLRRYHPPGLLFKARCFCASIQVLSSFIDCTLFQLLLRNLVKA